MKKMTTETNHTEKHKCPVCGGDLVLTIGSDRAVCDHCGEARAVDPRDVKKYADVYNTAETLMRTGTRAGYEDALTRLQAISFIPQAREKAALCEQRLQTPASGLHRTAPTDGGEEKGSVALGVIIAVLTALFFAAAVFCTGWAIYKLSRGQLTPTQIVLLLAAAGLFAVMLLIGRSKKQ